MWGINVTCATQPILTRNSYIFCNVAQASLSGFLPMILFLCFQRGRQILCLIAVEPYPLFLWWLSSLWSVAWHDTFLPFFPWLIPLKIAAQRRFGSCLSTMTVGGRFNHRLWLLINMSLNVTCLWTQPHPQLLEVRHVIFLCMCVCVCLPQTSQNSWHSIDKKILFNWCQIWTDVCW